MKITHSIFVHIFLGLLSQSSCLYCMNLRFLVLFRKIIFVIPFNFLMDLRGFRAIQKYKGLMNHSNKNVIDEATRSWYRTVKTLQPRFDGIWCYICCNIKGILKCSQNTLGDIVLSHADIPCLHATVQCLLMSCNHISMKLPCRVFCKLCSITVFTVVQGH